MEGKMVTNISLGEFIKLLAAKLHSESVEMPFENEQPWHLIFYELKKETGIKGKPDFFEHLRFDWDGPFPKSQQISDFLQALHWNASVSARNPHYDRIELPEEIATLWLDRVKTLDEDAKEFLDKASSKAQQEFSGKVIIDNNQ